jgi:hypothetical protein
MTMRTVEWGTGHGRPTDEGSIIPLLAGAAAFALAVVLVVTAATSLYVDHKRLLSLADAAALVGAEAYDLAEVEVTDDGVRVPLRPERVNAAVSDYLADLRPETVPVDDVTLMRAGSDDGRSATVVLRGSWSPPVLTVFVPEGLPLEVTSTARSIFD